MNLFLNFAASELKICFPFGFLRRATVFVSLTQGGVVVASTLGKRMISRGERREDGGEISKYFKVKLRGYFDL